MSDQTDMQWAEIVDDLDDRIEALVEALEAAHGFVIWAADHGANEAACVAVEAMVREAIAQAKGEPTP